VERLILDIQNKQYLETLLNLIKKSGLSKGVKPSSAVITQDETLPVVPADSSIHPHELFGIWKGRNLTKECLRAIAWGGR
jgi:hypothetical protein